MFPVSSMKVNEIRLDLSQRKIKNNIRYILNLVGNINQPNKKDGIFVLDAKITFDSLERPLTFNETKRMFSETFS